MIKNSIKDFYFIGENASKSVYLSMSRLPLKSIKVSLLSRFKWLLLETFSCVSVSLIHSFHPDGLRVAPAYLCSPSPLLVQSVLWSLLLRPGLWSCGGCGLLADYPHPPDEEAGSLRVPHGGFWPLCLLLCARLPFCTQGTGWTATPLILETCS